jgi:hypothetical protein
MGNQKTYYPLSRRLSNRRPIRTKRRSWFESLEQRTLFDTGGLLPSPLAPVDDAAEGEATSTVASVQIAPLPVRTFNVVFSQPMAIEPLIADGSIRTAFSLQNLESGSVDLSSSTFVYHGSTRTLTWTSPTALPAGLYELRLNGTLLQDTAGSPLHGGTGGLAFTLPVFAAPQNVQAGATALDVDAYSVPALADWNADGVRDLIVGEKTASGAGKVRVYLNSGTAAAPIFESSVYAQQGGSDLSVPGAGCLGIFPRVFDWDRDGKQDLVVGLADGRVQVFPNVATNTAPAFGNPTYITVGPAGTKAELDVGVRATPDIVDWNNDGREDLVVGALDGKVRILLDQATVGAPDFGSTLVLRDGANDLTVASGRSSVAVADMNRDGRKDLLLGNTDGQLFFYPNVGTDRAPAFAGSEMIAVGGVNVDLPGSPRTRPFIGSLQPQGLPELWLGEEQGFVQHYDVSSWSSPTSAPIQDGPPGGTFSYFFEATASAWQNPGDSLDVSGDGNVVPGDVLMIINELNHPTCHDESGLMQLPPPPGTAPPYHDVNGDGYCTPRDALIVINYLNAQAAGEGEAAGLSSRDALFAACTSALAHGEVPSQDAVARDLVSDSAADCCVQADVAPAMPVEECFAQGAAFDVLAEDGVPALTSVPLCCREELDSLFALFDADLWHSGV